MSTNRGISTLGASGVASRHGGGMFDPSLRLGVEEDESGLDSAKKIMERAIELAKLVKTDTDS